MNDWLAELEKKPTEPGPWWRSKSENGVRWSSPKVAWANEPWSFAARRLATIKAKRVKKIKPAIQGRIKGCLHAGVASKLLPMRAMMAVGFGSVDIHADGQFVWGCDDPSVRVSRVEKMAASRPRLDWKITFNGPLSGTTYQRQGPRRWVLVEQNQGFA